MLVDALGLLLAAVLAGLSLGGMGSFFQDIIAGIGTVLLTIISPLLVLLDTIASWLGEHLANLLSNLPRGLGNTFNVTQNLPAATNQSALVAILSTAFKFLVLAIIFGGALLLLSRTLRRRDAEKTGSLEEREQVAAQGILSGVGAALRNALSSMQDALPLDWLTWRRLLDAMSIRWQYARMAERAAILGFPRGDSETPFEYQDQLRQAFPGFDDKIALVTVAYVNVHYGELPDSPQGFSAVKDAVDEMLASSQDQVEQRYNVPT
jgi:hypothetical protein